MELISIIYNVLLIVFTLLSLIILSSLASSKLNLCEKNKRREPDFAQSIKIQKAGFSERDYQKKNHDRYEESAFVENEFYHETPSPIIKKELLEQNKTKVVSKKRTEQFDDFHPVQNYGYEANSRFMVVNRIAEENRNRDLNYKFSRMSVQYQQTA